MGLTSTTLAGRVPTHWMVQAMSSLQATLPNRRETPALMRPQRSASRGRPAHGCLFFGLLGCWLLAHPYQGIQHDNILYALQALHHLTPAAFQTDIFLQYGAQDQYTIFTPLYAAVIARLGLHYGTLLLLLSAHLAWIFAAIGIFRYLLTSPWRWIALAALFMSTGAYGSYGIFHFAEPFVTPRLLSELCGLLVLLLIVKNRLLAAGITLTIAALLHPIMALTTACVTFVYLTLQNRRWLWVGAAAASAVVLLGVGGVEPFPRLFQRMEPAWREMVEWRNNYLFISQYRLLDWSYLLHTSIVVLLSAIVSEGKCRRLLLASLYAAWGGLLINAIGVDWLSNVFILQIQIWRTLWLLHVMYALAIAALVRWCHPWRDVQLLVCSLLAAAWLTRCWETLGIAFSCLLLLTIYVVQQRQLRTIPRQVRWAAFAVLLFAASATGSLIAHYDTSHMPSPSALRLAFITFPAVFLLAPLLVGWIGYHTTWQRGIRQHISNAGLIALCAIGILGWHQQSDWSRYVEQTTESTAFFRHLTPPGATVLWVGNSRHVWLGMRRAAYLNPHQGAGFTFSADLAATYKRRQHAIADILHPTPEASQPPDARQSHDNTMWQLDDKRFQRSYMDVCRISSGLDFIVAPVAVADQFIAHWHSPVPLTGTRLTAQGRRAGFDYKDFYLYACARYRNET